MRYSIPKLFQRVKIVKYEQERDFRSIQTIEQKNDTFQYLVFITVE